MDLMTVVVTLKTGEIRTFKNVDKFSFNRNTEGYEFELKDYECDDECYSVEVVGIKRISKMEIIL